VTESEDGHNSNMRSGFRFGLHVAVAQVQINACMPCVQGMPEQVWQKGWHWSVSRFLKLSHVQNGLWGTHQLL